MKTIEFETKEDFQTELDGRIFQIGNADNTEVLCEVLEEDLEFLVEAYEVVCVYGSNINYKGSKCDYAVRDKYKTFETLKRAVQIKILN